MPIHDQGYRRYQGTRAPEGRAWAVITSTGVRTLLRRRAFAALLLLSWIPFVVRAVQIYFSSNLPQGGGLAPTPKMFLDFLGQQDTFVFFIAVWAGSGLVANDRRANALQIYLSKPLTRAEYIVGKLATLMVFLLMVTWVPALALLLVQILFAGNFAFLLDNLHLLPAITLATVVQALTVSSAMLALSSLSNSSRYVGVLYAGLMFFSQALYGVVFVVTRDTSWAWISLPGNLSQISALIFRLPPQYSTPWFVSALVIVAIIGGSAVVLNRRVQGVEVIV